ncbi:glycosyltransferase [uncultured Thiodictyon sp.]|jgi:glycosyltransferase involved in cell wall biosynthesis|uniref:glycosyltransferase n=1 Tax=uncultured Thiodictyon sp. TaxID=1846217 RepID=UPI0025E3C95A|nr:glycosyltransferase [uncultured Thiodictyon sp.]
MGLSRIACFFSTSGHSGVDRAAGHLIPALARRGYAVDLLKVRRHGPNLPEVPSGVRVIDLGSRHTYACLPAVASYLRRERPAVLLSDKDRVNRTALFARTLARVQTRLVFSSGTTISIDLATRGAVERWVQRNSMGRLYPFADQVIVTSSGVADDMAAYTGLARDLIRVVPSPVVPEALFGAPPPRPDHPWLGDPAAPLILSVGELCHRKGFDTLLRAFARVRAQRPCRLMILGRGGAREALLALAAELGVAADFALPGYCTDPYAYMAHADLFAFTSRWEGLGFVLIEALAVGTPVVSTDCPSGPREVLADGRYGPLVPVDDDDALAAALTATLDHPLPAARLREAARPYGIEASTDAYLNAMGLPPCPE